MNNKCWRLGSRLFRPDTTIMAFSPSFIHNCRPSTLNKYFTGDCFQVQKHLLNKLTDEVASILGVKIVQAFAIGEEVKVKEREATFKWFFDPLPTLFLLWTSWVSLSFFSSQKANTHVQLYTHPETNFQTQKILNGSQCREGDCSLFFVCVLTTERSFPGKGLLCHSLLSYKWASHLNVFMQKKITRQIMTFN